MSDYLTIPTKDSSGSFQAYIAVPEITPAPAIVVIQEIFGVNEELRKKCDELAAQGYLAIAPDLFWRMEPGVDLTDKTEEEWAKAFGFFQRFDIDKGIEDLRATAHVVRGHAYGTGKVGCIGYCLGGKLAYLMAARADMDCSVGYYGVGLDELLPEAGDIIGPLMLHIAEEDEYVSKDAQAKIKEGLKDHPHVTIYSYPGADHAFARGGGIHYHEESAVLANGRTAAFLDEKLGLKKAA